MFEQYTNDSRRGDHFILIAGMAGAGAWVAVLVFAVFCLIKWGGLAFFIVPILALPIAAVGAIIGSTIGYGISSRVDPD